MLPLPSIAREDQTTYHQPGKRSKLKILSTVSTELSHHHKVKNHKQNGFTFLCGIDAAGGRGEEGEGNGCLTRCNACPPYLQSCHRVNGVTYAEALHELHSTQIRGISILVLLADLGHGAHLGAALMVGKLGQHCQAPRASLGIPSPLAHLGMSSLLPAPRTIPACCPLASANLPPTSHPDTTSSRKPSQRVLLRPSPEPAES